MASKLTTIAQQRSVLDMQMLSRESVLWMQGKMRTVRNPGQEAKAILGEDYRKVQNIQKGQFYFYFYQAKHEETLPYWDRFPLTLVLEKYDDGFLGLNLHYLPVLYRAAFMDQLMDYAKYDRNGELERLKVTYRILEGAKRLKAFQPCIKRYLYEYMRSRPLTVDSSEWETALFLPVERFQKANKNKVFEDSINTLKNN